MNAIRWLGELLEETHWSFVVAVVVIYGINQGFGYALAKVGTDYYMKDVQKLQPSESQVYLQIARIPWVIKPIWGLFTDIVPFFGYHRRPYFILAGIVGILSMLFLSLHEKLHIGLALLSLMAGNAGGAIADVTVDACIAHQSVTHRSLAPHMQSLCSMSSSIGALIGYSLSGVFLHLIGPKGVYGLLSIPYALMLLVGILLDEQRALTDYTQVPKKFWDAIMRMLTTLIRQDVWGQCFYMFISFALSLNIHEGLFKWETDSKAGPSFSQEAIGFISSIGSVGSLFGAILYQHSLKTHPIRNVLFWAQLFLSLSGMLDLVLILRLNLKLGIPDMLFAIINESVFQLVQNLKWLTFYVITSKLCPSDIEGTFFALVMSIDNLGNSSSEWLGGSLLCYLNVTSTQFDKLWQAILIRNVMRIAPLCFLCLVPNGGEDSESGSSNLQDNEALEPRNVELTPLIANASS
ncbi:unnamed protein product [Lactuca virosa]|uniref:Biopterin transport-related protein BT1 n=1 Tax=Lactuca virosa TaxID=75947 RepID=A0AAU9LLX2_9ASTR|nr:unnamed protein product [Lactuca virosa]